MRGYVVERNGRFYAGLDPIAGRERRRWHAAGTDRAEAKQVAVLLAEEARANDATPGLTVARFLLNTWLPVSRSASGRARGTATAATSSCMSCPTSGGYRCVAARTSPRHALRRAPRQRSRRWQGRPRRQVRTRDPRHSPSRSARRVPPRVRRPQRRRRRRATQATTTADRRALLELRATPGLPEDGEDRPAVPRLLARREHWHTSQRAAWPAMGGRRPR